MKRTGILVLILIMSGLSQSLSAQGYALRFNRVIDTVFVAVINSCSPYTSSGQNGTTAVVPSGCVWKIESVGPAGVNGNCFYNDCSYNGSCVRTLSSVYFVDGQGERGYLYKYEHTGSNYQAFTPTGTVWLREGTQVVANIGHTSSSTLSSSSATVSSPWYIRVPVTIIEFITVAP